MKKYFYNSVVFLVAATAVFSILGYFGSTNWILDLFSHFKWQYLIILTIGTLIILMMRKKIALIFIPFVVVLIIEIAPLYFGGNKKEDLSESTKIVCINLLSSNHEFKEVERFIIENSPDLIVLEEFTSRWQLMLEPKLKAYKYRLSLPRKDNFGMAVYSKIRLTDLQELKLGNAGVPSISCNFWIGNSRVRLIATHPLPPVNTDYFKHRNAQLSEIATLASELDSEVVLIGDLNTSSFSTHFKSLVEESGLIDSRKGFGVLTSWPTWFGLARTTLDHCLISKGLLVKSRAIGEDIGSDHLPILIELGVK